MTRDETFVPDSALRILPMPRPPDLSAETLPLFRERVAALTPAAARKWGSLTPARMLRHLREMVGMSLGEVEAPDESNFIFRAVVRPLFFEWMTTWPHNLKAPDRFTPDAEGDLEVEREALLAALARFVARQSAEPDRVASHPVFGPQTLRYWGRLHGVHFAHHFRQFGV